MPPHLLGNGQAQDRGQQPGPGRQKTRSIKRCSPVVFAPNAALWLLRQHDNSESLTGSSSAAVIRRRSSTRTEHGRALCGRAKQKEKSYNIIILLNALLRPSHDKRSPTSFTHAARALQPIRPRESHISWPPSQILDLLEPASRATRHVLYPGRYANGLLEPATLLLCSWLLQRSTAKQLPAANTDSSRSANVSAPREP